MSWLDSKKIPTKTNIFGTNYKIKEVPDLEMNGEAVDGTYSVSERTICIDADLNYIDKVETLLHECGHAIFSEVSFDHVISKDIEHLIVQNFGKYFAKLLLPEEDKDRWKYYRTKEKEKEDDKLPKKRTFRIVDLDNNKMIKIRRRYRPK